MSIILDALKKANQDREKKPEQGREPLFRQMEYEAFQNQRRGKNANVSGRVIGYIAFLILGFGLAFILLSVVMRKEKPPERQIVIATPLPTPTPKPTMTPTPKPSPTPTPTPRPTPTPSPTPSPTPTPTPPPTETPTPTETPFPTPRQKGYDNPDDLGIKFEGVMWDQQKPAAMINDEIVYKGQMSGETTVVTVVDITKDYVAIKLKGNVYKFAY